MIRAAAALGILGFLQGCSASVAPLDAGSDGVGLPIPCNSVAVGPFVTSVEVPRPSSAPTGGTIVDGAYQLTRIECWGGAVSSDAQGLVVSGSSWQAALQEFSSGPIRHENVDVTVSGNRVVTTTTCSPSGLGLENSSVYTATPTMFQTRQDTTADAGCVSTFTRQ